MIDDTIGGPDARLALNSQLVDARADLEEIVKGGKALDRTARRHKVELEAFIAHLEQQRVGSPLYCRECSTAFLS